MRNAFWFFGAVVLCACGPSGTLNGKVEVQGGSAANVAVIAYGPVSAAAVTGDDGAFSFTSLPDGKYVVRATVSNVDPETQSGSATLTGGKQDADILLTFKAANAKVTGKVRFTDASSPEALTVTAVGSETRSARTSADGSFTFDDLKTGAYVLTVEVAGTKEGRASIGVNASGTVDAGELVLTPVGTVTGTVTYNSMPAAGVSVTIPGTSIGTVTDSAGNFMLSEVPGGMQNLRAQSGSEPFFRSATAMLIVKRGANDPVGLALNDDAPKTGTVTGIVTFRGGRSPRDITVSVRGTSVTANPGPNGLFTIAAPIGEWDIVASAPQHPAMVLGRVLVSEGSTQSLPGQTLSWYRPIFINNVNLTNATAAVAALNGNWSFGFLNDASGQRNFVVNSQTGEFRILFAGPSSALRISANGKYVAWLSGSTAFTYEIASGAMHAYWKEAAITHLSFSSDESTLFIGRTTVLARIPLAAPNTETLFPSSGTALSLIPIGSDRWLINRDNSTFDLVGTTTAGDASSVFTGVYGGFLGVTPVPWALTGCNAVGVGCTLRVLGANATTTQPDTSVSIAASTFSDLSAPVIRGTAEYPCFSAGGVGFCVSAAAGTHYPLPGIPFRLIPNFDGSRVLSEYLIGGVYSVREEAMPPGSATAALVSGPDPYQVDWLSADRAYAWRNPTHELSLIKASAVSATDTDIAAGQGYFQASLILVQRNSMPRWSVLIGDGAFRDLPITSSTVLGWANRGYVVSRSWSRVGAVSFDSNSFFAIDDAAGTVKQLFGAYANTGAGFGRSNAGEIFLMNRTDGSRAMYSHATGALLDSDDQGASLVAYVGSNNSLSVLKLATDSRSLLLGSFVP